MKQKLFSLLFAIVASIGTLFAAGTKIDDLYYNLNETDKTADVTWELALSSNNNNGLTTASIPASVTYRGKTYSITSIGDDAFSNCSSLTSVTIGNSNNAVPLFC